MRTLSLALLLFACDDGGVSTSADVELAEASDARVELDTALDPDLSIDAAPDAARDAAVDAPDAAPPIGGDRPTRVFAPSGEPPAEGWPIVLLLHGFGANQDLIDRNFPFSDHVEAWGFLVAVPIGTPTEDGRLRWRSDFNGPESEAGPDVDHLREVLASVVERHQGDPARVIAIGHSNGGAMARKLACFAPELLRAFVNASGWNSPFDTCTPNPAPSAFFVHGTEDADVPYAGGGERPGSEAAAEQWATELLGCADPETLPPIDYDLLPGEETHITRWACLEGKRVEQWRMQDNQHIFIPNEAFLAAVLSLAD